MKTLSTFVLILLAGFSSGAVDGEGLAKELTKIRDEIAKATGIKFPRIIYNPELESTLKAFNRNCSRWDSEPQNPKEYSHLYAPIRLGKNDRIYTQLMKDVVDGRDHPNPRVQDWLQDSFKQSMMKYLLPRVVRIGCSPDSSCTGPIKCWPKSSSTCAGPSEIRDMELKFAKEVGLSTEMTMDGACIVEWYYLNEDDTTSPARRKVAEYYLKNGLEEKLEKLLIDKTSGKPSKKN